MSSISDRPSRYPRDVLAILLLLCLLLIGFQYITLDKFKILDQHRRYDLPGFLHLVRHVIPLDTLDYVLGSLIIVLFLSLIALEFFQKRLSLLLAHIFETEARTRIALTLVGFILVRFYFARGESAWQGDTIPHLSYLKVISHAFRHGEFPIWTNFYANGTPYLQFYGVLFFYIVGFIDLLVRDLFFSLKLVLACMHVLSGIGLYAFVASLCKSRQAGFIAGIAYILCFWHTQQVLIMGRLPLSVFYALLPWPFYFFERLCNQTQSIPSILLGGLTLGILAYIHPGYAFWATTFLALYMATRLIATRSQGLWKHQGVTSLLILLTGLLFGAYITLPMWAERAFVGLEGIFSLSGLPDPTWKHVLFWSNYRLRLFPFLNQHWYGGYLGISLILIAGLGGIGLAFRKDHPHVSLLVSPALCLILSLILVFCYRLPVIRSLGVVQAFNAGRYLLFVTFFLSVMVGVGVTLWVPNLWDGQPRKRYTLLLILITLDLGPTTFQHPYIDSDAAVNHAHISPEIHRKLKDNISQLQNGELPDRRFLYLSDTAISFLPNAWLVLNTNLPCILGAYNENPISAHKYCQPLLGFLESTFATLEQPDDLKASPRFAQIVRGLYLLNVGDLFFYWARYNQIHHWKLPNHSPIVVAPQLSSWNPLETQSGERFSTLLEKMHINVFARTCQRIFLDEHIPPQNLGTTPQIEVLSHRVWNQRVVLSIKTSDACFARLAYAYYPYLRVRVNGSEQEPRQTAGGFIALKLEKGEHEIVLEPYLSPLRTRLLILNIILLALATFCLFKYRPKTALP